MKLLILVKEYVLKYYIQCEVVALCLQVVLAEWGRGDYYVSKVVGENPLRLMFTYEPITSTGNIKFTNKSLKWNRNDQQLADKDYIICYIPDEMVTMTTTGLKVTDKEECIKFLSDGISAYEA